MSRGVVRLGGYVELVMGQAPPGDACNKEGKGTIFIKAGEFQERSPVVREWTSKPLKIAKPNDTLVCVVGATAGKVNYSTFECAIGRSVAAVRPIPGKLDPLFLFHFLQTTVGLLRDRAQGAAQGVITREMLQALLLVVPPLPEQRRIAAILDRADALRAKRRESLAQLDELTQSIFIEMFGDPVRNTKNWPTKLLGDVLLFIKNGANIEQTDDSAGWPVSRIETIWNGGIDSSRVRYAKPNKDLSDGYEMSVGDILFSHINSPEHIAKTAIYVGIPSHLIHGINLLRLRCMAGEVHPTWLLHLLKHQSTRTHFRIRCKKAVNQASLNQQDIKSFSCIAPPFNLQVEFSNRVTLILKRYPLLQKSKVVFDSLFTSLQHRAFRGEL